MLPVAGDGLSSLLGAQGDVSFGLVGACVGPWGAFWVVFMLGLALGYTDGLLVFRWVLVVLLLWLVCFCFAVGGGDFVTSLSGVGRARIVGAFGSASGCLDDLLGIDSPCFEGVVGRVCPPGLRLGGANTSDTEAPFLGLRLSVSDGFVSSGFCSWCGDFGFDMVSFPFLDGGVPRSASCGVCVSRLVRLGYLVVWLVSVPVVGVWLPGFSSGVVGVVDFVGRMWDLIVSVPDHCLSFYFAYQSSCGCAVWWS